MTTTTHEATIAALLAEAAAHGISLQELAKAENDCTTVGGYITRVLPTASPGQARTYGPYLNMFAEQYGQRGLTTVTVTDITAFCQQVESHAVATRGQRRNARGGRSARENAIAGLRWLYTRAIGDNLATNNPALGVSKPPRPRQTRHGLTATQLTELFEATKTGGNDPTLDTLLTRFLVEAGARREGAINLRLRDLDPTRCTVLLREKNDQDGSDQPVSPGLIKALATFAKSRGAADPNDAVFRYLPKKGTHVGPPLTRRRFNTLADRWQETLPFAARLGVTPHSLRHTAVGMVESIAGYAIARQFARHHSNREVTTTYLQRDIHDVAWAIQQLTEEPHPLAKDRWQLG